MALLVTTVTAVALGAIYVLVRARHTPQKVSHEVPKTAEKLCEWIKTHPKRINDKIDWIFPSGSHRFEDREKEGTPLKVENVVLAQLLCAGSLADPKKTDQILAAVIDEIDLEEKDESSLFSYVDSNLSKGSGNNVLKTAIASASGCISGMPERRSVVERLLGKIATLSPQKRAAILDAGDNFTGGSHTAAGFLIRQGHEDLALRAVEMGGEITDKVVYLAAWSVGTTDYGFDLINHVIEKRIESNSKLDNKKSILDGLKAGRLPESAAKWLRDNEGFEGEIPLDVQWEKMLYYHFEGWGEFSHQYRADDACKKPRFDFLKNADNKARMDQLIKLVEEKP